MTGTGTGGSAAGAPGAAGGAGALAVGNVAAGAEAVYDSSGNLISGGSGAVAGQAIASPFKVDGEAWGWQQSVMLGAVLLLIAVVAVPPFLSGRFRGRAAR